MSDTMKTVPAYLRASHMLAFDNFRITTKLHTLAAEYARFENPDDDNSAGRSAMLSGAADLIERQAHRVAELELNSFNAGIEAAAEWHNNTADVWINFRNNVDALPEEIKSCTETAEFHRNVASEILKLRKK